MKKECILQFGLHRRKQFPLLEILIIGLKENINSMFDGMARGIWEGFIPNVQKGDKYKYKIHSNNNGIMTEKADPFASRCEHPPKTASVVWDWDYTWKDKKWMDTRKEKNATG